MSIAPLPAIVSEPVVSLDIKPASVGLRARADRPRARQSQPQRSRGPVQPTRPCGYDVKVSQAVALPTASSSYGWRLTARGYAVIAVAFMVTVVVTAMIAVGAFLGVSNAPMP